MEIVGQIFLGIIAFLIILKVLWYLFSLISAPFTFENINADINSLKWEIDKLKSELENLKNDSRHAKEEINSLKNKLNEVNIDNQW